MPLIEVSLITGRTAEQKRRMAKALEDAVVQHGGARRANVQVIFRDVAEEDWLVGGEDDPQA